MFGCVNRAGAWCISSKCRQNLNADCSALFIRNSCATKGRMQFASKQTRQVAGGHREGMWPKKWLGLCVKAECRRCIDLEFDLERLALHSLEIGSNPHHVHKRIRFIKSGLRRGLNLLGFGLNLCLKMSCFLSVS